MATTEHGGHYSQVEAGADLPERPGDLTALDHTIEGLDHWLGQLISRLEPVLRPEYPTEEKALATLREPQSPLADRINRLEHLQSLLARTVDRIAL